MPAARKEGPPVQDRIRAELQLIKRTVAGVSGSLVATTDGLVVAYDVPDLEPTQIAALAAATLSLASRATLATGRGSFREAVARGSDGYLAVYAAGVSAIVAVIGTSNLNLGMLNYQARDIIGRVAEYSSEFGQLTTPIPARRSATGSASTVTGSVGATASATAGSTGATAEPAEAAGAAGIAPAGTPARTEVRPLLPRRRTSGS
jgi:predicted regulator of Ras-like GTPase activity (Roadblock/LC7/MglB family)